MEPSEQHSEQPLDAAASALVERWPLPDRDLARRLVAAYGHEGRGYHDPTHLREVLDRLDELAAHGEAAAGERAVVLAAWFHDAVYEGGADDEERSAQWAREALAAQGCAPGVVDEVARLVRLTAGHDPADDDAAGRALCDADLAILAAGPERYADYVTGVRREYAHVLPDDFARGRGAVLRELLERPRLFSTPHAHTHWEAAARENIALELEVALSRPDARADDAAPPA